jgi:hypothetical protein
MSKRAESFYAKCRDDLKYKKRPFFVRTESPIKIRPASYDDLKQLADLHYRCSIAQPAGFMFKLGRGFILEYYRISFRNKASVILCADAGMDGIVGLVFATLDSKENLDSLKMGGHRLFLGALPALIRQPMLIKEILSRIRSLWRSDVGEGFIIGSGARIAYWGWLPNYPSKANSIFLLKALLKTLKEKNVSQVRFEIDRLNRKVELIHRLLGAKVVREFNTPDGRSRIIMEYILA